MHPLFAIPVHIKPVAGSAMPEGALGAYLVCYSVEENHIKALKQTVDALSEDHYQFIELNGKITELESDYWTEYVAATWPDEKESLPSLQEIRTLQQTKGVVYSPFCCYEAEEETEPDR